MKVSMKKTYKLARTWWNRMRSIVTGIAIAAALLACNAADENTELAANEPMKAVQSVSERAADGYKALSAVAAGESKIVNELEQSTAAGSLSKARFATTGTIAAHRQRPGDINEGKRALLEESYVSCGIPERVFRTLQENTDVVGVERSDATADGLPFSVNVFSNDENVNVVSSNCLTCHGTVLFGDLVIGLGNEFLDFTNDASALVERAGALVQGEAETRAWELYADRINAIAPYSRTHTLGVNPANNLTFALTAYRDADTNAWSQTPLLPLPPTDVPPVSVPPWWRMAKKPAMFNLGEGRLDHARIMMAASMLCTDNVEDLKAIDAYAPDIRAFIASLTAPSYPFPIDGALVEAGRDVFLANCSHCHGSYEGEDDYPARLVPIELVQTDSTLVDFALNEGAPYIDWFNRSFYGELSTIAPGSGYVAPPLDGIWATAPFLHNGSVPTIAMVLNSAQRPRYWQLEVNDASDPQSYDQVRMGWAFSELPGGKSDASDIRIYDTDLPGYGNGGHTFGDHLSADDRLAVIEYLKTL